MTRLIDADALLEWLDSQLRASEGMPMEQRWTVQGAFQRVRSHVLSLVESEQ